MYTVVFENENGSKFVFGKNVNTAADFDIGSGLSINLGTSQGFGQVGETVDTQKVSGRNIAVNGVMWGDVPSIKTKLRGVCAPFAQGRLVFNNKYYIKVYVKDSPSFSPKKDDGRFSMRFFAPYPFFFDITGGAAQLGTIEKLFSFPVNYAEPHVFGRKSASKYINIVNNGDVSVPFSVKIVATADVSDITLTNIETLAFLKIEGSVSVGDEIHIYRSNSNILKAELHSNGEITDILYRISDDSTLFELAKGDNLIGESDSGGGGVEVQIEFNKAVAAVYED